MHGIPGTRGYDVCMVFTEAISSKGLLFQFNMSSAGNISKETPQESPMMINLLRASQIISFPYEANEDLHLGQLSRVTNQINEITLHSDLLAHKGAIPCFLSLHKILRISNIDQLRNNIYRYMYIPYADICIHQSATTL